MATIVDGYDSKWVYAGHRYIAAASGRDVPSWVEVVANARLIAACPTMYDYIKTQAEKGDEDAAKIINSIA